MPDLIEDELTIEALYHKAISCFKTTSRFLKEIQDILNEDYIPRWALEIEEALTLENHLDDVNDYIIQVWEFILEAQKVIESFELQSFESYVLQEDNCF